MEMAAAMQFTEDERAPEESPELIGVGEGNAGGLDAYIFCGVLLGRDRR